MKVCGKCGKEKELDKFHIDNSKKDRLQIYCKDCRSEKASSTRKKISGTPDTFQKDQIKRLKYFYGITIDQYNDLLEMQNGGCKFCGGVNSDGKILCVDHDHNCCSGTKTCGKCIRGLLCTNHNSYLGLIENNIDQAIDYLSYWGQNA